MLPACGRAKCSCAECEDRLKNTSASNAKETEVAITAQTMQYHGLERQHLPATSRMKLKVIRRSSTRKLERVSASRDRSSERKLSFVRLPMALMSKLSSAVEVSMLMLVQ